MPDPAPIVGTLDRIELTPDGGIDLHVRAPSHADLRRQLAEVTADRDLQRAWLGKVNNRDQILMAERDVANQRLARVTAERDQMARAIAEACGPMANEPAYMLAATLRSRVKLDGERIREVEGERDKAAAERDALMGVVVQVDDFGDKGSCLVWLGRYANNRYGTERFATHEEGIAAVRKAAGLTAPDAGNTSRPP